MSLTPGSSKSKKSGDGDGNEDDITIMDREARESMVDANGEDWLDVEKARAYLATYRRCNGFSTHEKHFEVLAGMSADQDNADFILTSLNGVDGAIETNKSLVEAAAITGALFMSFIYGSLLEVPDALGNANIEWKIRLYGYLQTMVVASSMGLIAFALFYTNAITRTARDVDKLRVLAHGNPTDTTNPLLLVLIVGGLGAAIVANSETYPKWDWLVQIFMMLGPLGLGVLHGISYRDVGHVWYYWKQTGHKQGEEPVHKEVLMSEIAARANHDRMQDWGVHAPLSRQDSTKPETDGGECGCHPNSWL